MRRALGQRILLYSFVSAIILVETLYQLTNAIANAARKPDMTYQLDTILIRESCYKSVVGIICH